MAHPISPDMSWFVHADFSAYRGEYVVIIDREVVGHGQNAREVLQRVRRRYPDQMPALAKVPSGELLVL